MAKETMTVYVCDGCESNQIGELGDGVYGFAGKVTGHHDWGGGEGGEWFACSEKCVGPAVKTVCEKSMKEWG